MNTITNSVIKNSHFSDEEFEQAEESLKNELNNAIERWSEKGHLIVLKLKQKGITNIIDEVIFTNKHFKIVVD